MAELVDAHGSGPCAFGCGGSSPLLGTILYSILMINSFFVKDYTVYCKNGLSMLFCRQSLEV